MHFKNVSENSVYLEDIDLSIPFLGDTVQSLSTENVKKSRAFREMVLIGAFEIIQASDDRIEENLLAKSKLIMNKNEKEYKLIENISDTLSIRIRGHFYDNTGYAKVNRNLALFCAKNKINTTIEPVTYNNSLNEIEVAIINSLKKQRYSNSILVDSVIPPQRDKFVANGKILYTTSEAAVVPQQFIDIANTYDLLWTTSSFSAESFKRGGYKKPIEVVAPIINVYQYKKTQPMNFKPKLKSFNFVSVQTYGYRKGSDALVHGFCKAFDGNKDVTLTILSVENSQKQKNNTKKQIQEIKTQYNNPPTIHVCFKPIPEYLMPSFYSAFQSFVLTSRGEGFGLPICEASLCGLPIISANYSAITDYLTKDNATLIDIDEFEKKTSGTIGVHYWENNDFPKLGKAFVENLANSLKNVVDNYDEHLNKNKYLQKYIVDNFNGDKVYKKIYPILNDLWIKYNENSAIQT